MRTSEELAKQNIEIFIEKYPFPRPGWIVSSKNGHHTIRVHELETTRTSGRRFDVMISDRCGAVSALYDRLGKDQLRPVELTRLERLVAHLKLLGCAKSPSGGTKSKEVQRPVGQYANL